MNGENQNKLNRVSKMKLTFGSEFVYDWLQLEIEWSLLYFYFDDYFPQFKNRSAETYAC